MFSANAMVTCLSCLRLLNYKPIHSRTSFKTIQHSYRRCSSFRNVSETSKVSEVNSRPDADHAKRELAQLTVTPVQTFRLKQPELDYTYLGNPDNSAEIKNNICRRKGVGDVETIVALYEKLRYTRRFRDSEDACEQLETELVLEAVKVPNETHPDVKSLIDPKLVSEHGIKRKLDFVPRSLENIAYHWRLLRNKEFGILASHGAYFLQGDLALLEQALINFTVDRLREHGYTLVSVPDLVHQDVIEACGVSTTGERTLVYGLDYNRNGPVCLSGTAEMSLAGLFTHRRISYRSLPMRLVAVSRCYRAEAEGWGQESGLYRVHEFNKVEMFIVSEANVRSSEAHLQEIVGIQQKLFSDLGLHYQLLEMPPKELAAAAYHKYDIEAWMVGRNSYGEISSASNCTDYQSRRLHIKTSNSRKPNETILVHTINGTACAVPRMLIAIVEQNQQADFSVTIPEVLWPYMNNVKVINKRKCVKIDRLRQSKDS